MAGVVQRSIIQFTGSQSIRNNSLSTCLPNARASFRSVHYCCCWALYMNGCDAVTRKSTHVEIIQTRTFPSVPTLGIAMDILNSAISELKSNPPGFSSGIIRLEVPMEQHIEALGWLHSQNQLPRCFFSGRSDNSTVMNPFLDSTNEKQCGSLVEPKPISMAGVGAAVFFQQSQPFSLDDWKCIKRFLSKDCPLIRAYGVIRFDASTKASFEWDGFGSFYFMIPLVEFFELERSSMLAITIAWDDTPSCSWREAILMLQATMSQISSIVMNFRKEVPTTFILSNTHVPNKTQWDSAVNKALQMIRSNSELIKVVLARSSRVITTTDIDPIEWLAYLQGERQNAYQFCFQPPDAPVFIGNTPEQLFHRKHLNISSEALAGTRARGGSKSLDIQIENDLLCSPKDDLEFTIVRESIRKKLEDVCSVVLVEPKKTIRKLPTVQHLYAQLSGRLRNEYDEFDILSSLHPSPAVCGFPTELAREFIVEAEMFDRGMYAGPVGWFGGTETEFAVGIRSALVDKGVGTLIYAGAGIVEGTDSSLEWEEVELKTSQFTKLIERRKSQSLLMPRDGLLRKNNTNLVLEFCREIEKMKKKRRN